MKQKREKKARSSAGSKQTKKEVNTIADFHDETYRQINKISFQQNYRALIGHYKGESSASR